MTTYKDIQEILDEIVEDRNFGAHGAFWRGLNRDQFVEHSVFGHELISIGNPSESNLIKALKGLFPFSGAPFRRMPAGMPPASDQQILIIEKWIENGCPNESEEEKVKSIDYSDEHHNNYWREFDNWAMFHSTPETSTHINKVMGGFAIPWMKYINTLNTVTLNAWVNTLGTPSAKQAIDYLASKQRETVKKYYNDDDLHELIESYEKFGSGTLPKDMARPDDPDHKMNGDNMWAFWLCFADAVLRTKSDDHPFWIKLTKMILIGMTNDGLIRGRFPVMNYSRETIDEAKNYILGIPDDIMLDELIKFVNSTKLFQLPS